MAARAPAASSIPVGKVAATAGVCGALIGFAGGFRLAEGLYATDRDREMMYKKVKILTGVALGAAAVGVIISTVALAPR
eukprot:scaffold174249_cov40-Tisochrysis_lutea.AAC.1